MCPRSHSFLKPSMQTFSLVNLKPVQGKCGVHPSLFSPSCSMNERKTFGNVCHTTGANTTDKDRDCIQSHAPLSIFLAFFFLFVTIFYSRSKMLELFCFYQFLVWQLYKAKDEQYMCVCLCAGAHSNCGLCMSRVWASENVRCEWPAEENNKARMTRTDGLLYCPLKCKH